MLGLPGLSVEIRPGQAIRPAVPHSAGQEAGLIKKGGAMAVKTKDFEKIWRDTKVQVFKFSKETLDLLKKGEKEVVKASGKAKINFEIMLSKLKREQLFYIIGKESFKSSKKKRGSGARVAKLVKEVKEIEKQIDANKKLLHKKS